MTTNNVTHNYTLFRVIGSRSYPKGGKALVLGGGVLTTLILGVIYLLALSSIAVLTIQNKPDEMVFEVEAGSRGWEIHPPDQAITIANKLYIPLDEPITLQVIAAEISPAVWSSELPDKSELNQTNIIWLPADQYCAQQPPMCLRAIQRPDFSAGLALSC